MEVAFGEWLADGRDYRNPGLEDVENAIPTANGYGPARQFEGAGLSVSGAILGAGSSYRADGAIVIFAATASDLFVIRNGVVSASSLSLSLPADTAVVFEQFNSSVYATAKGQGTWVLSDFETDTAFVAASGSPPSANAMGRVADFLVMGDLRDIDATDAPYRLRWSRFNDPGGSWATDVGAQSGAIDLNAKFGPITAITGGTYGLIFQRQGITRISFTGGSTVFRLEPFEQNRGCVSPSSAVQVGQVTYYLAHDGFYATDGTTPRPISTAKIWEWFSIIVNDDKIDNVAGGVDYRNRCIVWVFAASPNETFTGQLWWNWETQQWGFVNQAVDRVVEGADSGLTLEEVGVLYPNLDTMPVSLDSDRFAPSGRSTQVFQDGEVGNLTGPPLQATFKTGDMQPFVGQRTYIDEITPLVEVDACNVRLGVKERMTQTLTETPNVAMGPLGYAPIEQNARYFRAIIEIPAGEEWSNPHGLQMNVRPGGKY